MVSSCAEKMLLSCLLVLLVFGAVAMADWSASSCGGADWGFATANPSGQLRWRPCHNKTRTLQSQSRTGTFCKKEAGAYSDKSAERVFL